MIYWFFGYPGSGKDYCAQKLSQLLDCVYIDSDNYLTDQDKDDLKASRFTAEQRLQKLKRICIDLQKAAKSDQNVVVTDSLPDEASRQFLLDSFPKQLLLIKVVADKKTIKERIEKRSNHFFTSELFDEYLQAHWQPITQQHLVIDNNGTGQEVLAQLKGLIKQ